MDSTTKTHVGQRLGKHKKPVPCSPCEGRGYYDVWEDGKKTRRACGRCNGTGTVS